MNTPKINNDELEEILVMEEASIGENSFLVVYNDDHNTFDWVIQCFIEICNHTFEQSEQLDTIFKIHASPSFVDGKATWVAGGILIQNISDKEEL